MAFSLVRKMKAIPFVVLLILANSCALTPKEPPKSKILFVVSNAYYYGDSDINTANHFPEIVFAYDEFYKAGYEIDFVSPQGGTIALGYIYSDSLLQDYLYNSDFLRQLAYTRKPSDVSPEDYKAIFYTGGGAAMFGVPSDQKIHEIATSIYEEQEGIVAAVCHGTAGIVDIELSNGDYLVKGKRVNGFPDLFEDKSAKYFQEFPFSIEEQVLENGGLFQYSEAGWDGYMEADDRLITGQDPTSSSPVAKAVIKRLASANSVIN